MRIGVLDHGYVELIEAWGTGKAGQFNLDLSNRANIEIDYEVGIVEAARQSTQGSFRGWDQDEKLLKHLYTNHHDTPFEMAGMVLEVQAPIMVFREWQRHRTQSYNEMSARYAPLPDLYYTPDLENILDRSKKAAESQNKQQRGSGTVVVSRTDAEEWLSQLEWFHHQLEHFYQFGLSIGIPKELARLEMPVGHYSRMRASANLRNWIAFWKLRTDSKAQWEIRQFAGAVGVHLEATFPHTWKLMQEEV